MYSCLHKYTKITNTCMTIKAKAIGMNMRYSQTMKCTQKTDDYMRICEILGCKHAEPK